MLGTCIGVDFGSATLNICVDGKGSVLCEPSVLVCDGLTGQPLAIGKAASEMIGRTPSSLTVVEPIRCGAIDNSDAVRQMLRPYFTLLSGNRLFKPNVLVCVRTGMSDNEKQTILEILADCGVGRASFVEKPIVAAIGAGLNCRQAEGCFCVEIGAGLVDAGVISMGRLCVSAVSKNAGRALTDAIRTYISAETGCEIGFLTAEEIKQTVASALPLQTDVSVLVNGKSNRTGQPCTLEISADRLRNTVDAWLREFDRTIHTVLTECTEELQADILEKGITLTGGGAKLRLLDRWLSEKYGIPVRVADNPEKAIVRGLEQLLHDAGGMAFADEYIYLASQNFAEDAETEF